MAWRCGGATGCCSKVLMAPPLDVASFSNLFARLLSLVTLLGLPTCPELALCLAFAFGLGLIFGLRMWQEVNSMRAHPKKRTMQCAQNCNAVVKQDVRP